MGIKKIQEDVELLRERLLERRTERFSKQDIVRAFFGALVIGITFIFASGLITIVKNINWTNIILIIFLTLVILVAEIYFIGWSRVKGERGRNIYEFTFKRLPAFYIISLIVAFFYIYIFGINNFLSGAEVIKMVFIMAMPCSIGAAIGDLLKKY